MPASPGPATSAPELASAFLACASTSRSRGTTWVSTIWAAVPATVCTLPITKPTRYSQVMPSQPSHQARGTLSSATASRQLAHHVDRQLAHAVQPHAAGQRKQHEGQHLDGREQAHLGGRGVQQHGRRQRQRQHRHLAAEGLIRIELHRRR
jgi:hypothetical protein